MFVCLWSISPELHVRSSLTFSCALPTAVARSSAGGVAIRYVLPVFIDDGMVMCGCMAVSSSGGVAIPYVLPVYGCRRFCTQWPGR